MTAASTGALRGALRAAFERRVMGRAALVVGAYAAATLLLLAAVVLARRAVSPESLRALLGFFFISTTASGLEPGTVKAAALEPGGALGRSTAAYVLAGSIKAVAASPLLALAWWVSDPQIPMGALAWLPLVCVAGFCTTDLRTLFDIRGRHALATGFKQGVHGLGHAAAAGLLIAGLPLVAAIGLSTLLRLALMGLGAWGVDTGVRGGTWREARRLLLRSRWLDFAGASALGSLSGATDRIFGLRYLPAMAFSAYYISFEGLARFWLLSFLIAPIVFARGVNGQGSAGLVRAAFALIVLAGAGLLAAIAVVMIAAPALVTAVVGVRLPLPTLALALSVVAGAAIQLRLMQLQAAGRTRATLLIAVITMMVAGLAFFIAARRFGVAGLMYAALVKAAVEFALTFALRLPQRRAPDGALDRAG